MKRNTKKGLLIVSGLLTVLAMGVAFISNSALSDGFLYRVRAQGEQVNSSITWSASSAKVEHQKNKVAYSGSTSTGMKVYLLAYGQNDASNDYMFSSRKSDYLDFYISINSESGTSSSKFQFQSITSVTIVTASSSDDGASFVIYTDSTATGSAVKTQTVSNSEESFTYTTEVSGAHYLTIKPNNTLKQVNIKSVTIGYSCTPGGGEPSKDTYSISYLGSSDGMETHALTEIDAESLVTSAEEDSEVSFSPSALSGYQLLGAFEYTEYIEDFDYTAGEVSFTMPSNNVTIIFVVGSTAVTLSSISLSGATTEFTVGDTFSFGGTVTAHYSDSSSANVTASTTFSGYNMSTAGEYTVTASYTEGGVTKTTDYSITVTSSSEGVVLSGTYNYASRSKYSTPDWSLYSMTITFYNDGTAMWRNVRTNTLGNSFDCKVYFTYVATDNGANITIEMAHTTYDFKKDGAYNNQASSFSGGGYDRPIDGGFGSSTSKNNSGVLSNDRNTLTICTYDQSHSYEVYDTFTFTLAA